MTMMEKMVTTMMTESEGIPWKCSEAAAAAAAAARSNYRCLVCVMQ